ncbi:DNA methyltransferase [Sphingomonas sp. GB1N7]
MKRHFIAQRFSLSFENSAVIIGFAAVRANDCDLGKRLLRREPHAIVFFSDLTCGVAMSQNIKRNLVVTHRPVASLRIYDGNARQHSKAQLKLIGKSIDEFGWTNPVLIDEDGLILCGAGRHAVAVARGMASVPTIVLAHMSEAQKRAYIIADNKLAEQSSWSKSLLRQELLGLVELGYDCELTGFSTLEIDQVISLGDDKDDAIDDDVHLPDQATPVSRLGDIWHIGKHRLIVGDARDTEVYARLLAGERAELIFTDPPYGCAIENNVSGLGQVRHKNFLVGAGEVSLPEFGATLLRPAFRCMAAHAQPGAIAFVCSDWRAAPYVHDAAQGIFLEQKNLIVWAKTNAGMGTFYRSAHELIHAFKVSPGAHINNFGLGDGGRYRTNVWTYPGANVFRKGRMQDLADHSTVKPKQMVADAILDCSTRGGLVLDCFAGSGTTLVAAELVGRRGYGIELDPQYADVILRRVSEAVGFDPLLDGTTPFDEVVKARSANLDEEAA